jgi:hypothetical protein
VAPPHAGSIPPLGTPLSQGPCAPYCANGLAGRASASVWSLRGDLGRLWRPVDPPCIRGSLEERPGIAASRVGEGRSLHTLKNTNHTAAVGFRAPLRTKPESLRTVNVSGEVPHILPGH